MARRVVLVAAPDLPGLLDSWLLALRAERKSPQTLKAYGDGVRRFLAWAEAAGRPPSLDRSTLSGFVAALLDEGAQPATAVSRQLAVRRFSAWLTEEGEQAADGLLGAKPPKIDVAVVPVLTEDQLRAMLAACAGPDLRDRRDEAILRLMIETAARAGEVVGLRVSDLNLRAGTAVVVRGKGGRGRTLPFGPQAGRSLDRYLRLRRAHRLAGTDALWLGDRGKEFTYYALDKTLKMRAERAGVEGFHAHVLRHTAASRWLAAGGSEGGLMAVAGWRRREMLDRYTAATASDRAATESRSLGLGDL